MTAVGLLHQMWELQDADEEAFYRRAIDEAQLADRLGFQSMWIGEHHYRQDRAFYGRVPSPELLIAHLLAHTERIHFGTGVKVVPLADPERTAEQMSMLFLLSGGRVEFGLGQGTGYAPLTIADPAAKSARFRDDLSRLLDLLQFAPCTADGHVISPAPAPELISRLWVASRDEAAVALAAEHDLGFVVGQAEHPALQAGYVANYRNSGGRGPVRGVRVVHVAETRAQALQQVKDCAELYWSTMRHGPYHRLAVEQGLLPVGDPAGLDDLLDRSLFIVGDPAHVRDRLDEYRAMTGVDRVDVMMQLPLLGTSSVADSMGLFMEHVAPELGGIAA